MAAIASKDYEGALKLCVHLLASDPSNTTIQSYEPLLKAKVAALDEISQADSDSSESDNDDTSSDGTGSSDGDSSEDNSDSSEECSSASTSDSESSGPLVAS
ncbi:hypothetical protein DFS34DRAFT_589273 [Phlyctochytrium arcticum]|nr:hypothetical protein DFS34DRAFT_589273 [Phlyctochytrium arcticum]